MYNTKFIATVLALGSLLGACDPEPENASRGATASLADYDGEDLFRGIVLGYGPVATVIPEIRDHVALANYVPSEQDRAVLEARFDELVDEMAAIDPEFFDDFETSLRSGDPHSIEIALADSRALVDEAMPRVPAFASAQGEGASAAAPLDKTLVIDVVDKTPIMHIWDIPALVLPLPPVLWRTVAGVAADGGVLHEQLVYRIATEGFVASE